MSVPVFNNFFSVYDEPNAVIGVGYEFVFSGFRDNYISGPAHGKTVLLEPQDGRTVSPVKVNLRIMTRRVDRAQILIAEIGSDKRIFVLFPKRKEAGQNNKEDH